MAVTKIPKKTITLIEPKKSFIVDKAQHRQKRVAAYCRVSTDSEEQLTSYTNQMKVYTEMIASNKEWEFAGLYADEGISGTRADKRPQFQKMIDDCHKGKIDMIITKSVSRFARNTVDCLDYVRSLKEIGVGIYFEEQNIKVYGKSLFRTFISQLLRNPVYAQADLELYEFFKSQGAAIVNDASDFAGTNGCYLYQGRDVKEDKDRSLKDQILVIAPHEALIPSDVWLKCRKKLMTNKSFQQGRKPKNTWLAGKVKCGCCGYALKATHVPNSEGYFRCSKRTENKGCPGCGKIRKSEFEEFIFSAMRARFKNFQVRHSREEKVNPKLTAHQIELAQVEAEIEKLLDTLTGANATLLAYANKKIEELDTRRQTISKEIAEMSIETMSPQKEQELSYYLDHWDSIEFDDKRKAVDGLIISISATSDHVQVEWKI